MSDVSRVPPHPPSEAPKVPPVAATPPVKLEPHADKFEPHSEQPREPAAPLTLEEAVDTLSAHMQSLQRNLQFSVDAEAGRTVVKVIDSATGDLIRQIPEETALDLARRLRTDSDVRLFDALG